MYYLYIKESPLGLKYLGKTNKNPYKYLGSGKYWKRHIKKHNLTRDDIKTTILIETESIREIINKGIKYSNQFNIVESNDWANLRIEDGNGGDTSKFIDFDSPVFRNSSRADHLNKFNTEDERQKYIQWRSSLIDYKSPERIRKIQENRDQQKWLESVRNRELNYDEFLPEVHESNKKSIIQFDLDGNKIKEHKSAVDAARMLNKKPGNIRQCLSNRNKTAYGYIWKYKK